MTKSQEEKIIMQSVNKAAQMTDSRKEAARLAAIFADERGVNVASAPYLHDIFCERLDHYFSIES